MPNQSQNPNHHFSPEELAAALGKPFPPTEEQAAVIEKIGRASCRERV